jgi:hypothetical protein
MSNRCDTGGPSQENGSRSTAFLDLVRDDATGRAVAVAALAGAESAAPWSGSGIPDPRFANARALVECVQDLVQGAGSGWRACVAPFGGAPGAARAILIELAAWCGRTSIADGAAITELVVPSRHGWRGGAAPSAGRLPDGAVLLGGLGRGLAEGGGAAARQGSPGVRLVEIPYGCPSTPLGLVVVRHLGACALGEPAERTAERWPWILVAPWNEALDELRGWRTAVAKCSEMPSGRGSWPGGKVKPREHEPGLHLDAAAGDAPAPGDPREAARETRASRVLRGEREVTS